MTDDEVLDRFRKLRVWQRGDERAPHKPLLLLLLLAKIQRGEEGVAAFLDVEGDLRDLLKRFGPKRDSYHPEYPFWRLQTDGIWSIDNGDRLRARKSNTDPPVSELRRINPTGKLDPELVAALRGNPTLVNQIATEILEREWESSYHEEILDAVGLPWVPDVPRDREFARGVLRIYERRCGVCGFDGRLGDQTFAVEAAHIRWHARSGPDQLDNGIALCVLHHKAFDRGALGLDEERRVLISQDVTGGPVVDEMLIRFAGAMLRTPLLGEPVPSAAFIRWHQNEVFRAPARRSER